MAIDTQTLINAFPQEVNSGGWALLVKIGNLSSRNWVRYSIIYIDRSSGILELNNIENLPIIRTFEYPIERLRASKITVSGKTIAIIINEKDQALQEATRSGV